MAGFKLDHFKAYTVVRENYQKAVEIQDQFHENWFPIILGERTHFLTPVKKNVGDIKDHTAYLTWYSLKGHYSIKKTVTYKNQMTDNQPKYLIIDELIGLLVPTRNHLDSGFPEKLDHYTVYKVINDVTVTTDIVLRDQFIMSAFSKMTLFGFCLPSLKRRNVDKEKLQDYKYNNKNDHLAIYQIISENTPLNKLIVTNNQFGKHSFTVLGQIYLLVPTEKLDWNPKTINEKPYCILHPCDL